jgi:hypothetical protein
VLYSDEGNPGTGVKAFKGPDAQKMSREQFDLLRETLAKTKDAQHVFLFLHHPRYQGAQVAVPERPAADPETSLLLQLDEIIGLRLPDDSASAAHAERCGKPTLVHHQ